MNCIIPGNNLKVLSKSLQSLSKIGDELYIEARTNQLSLITINTSKTTCGRFNFSDTFFTDYQIDNNINNNDNSDNIITCKVHLKVVLPLFRGNLEKKLDYFKIDYEKDNDFIIFKMKYMCDNIIMEHKLRLMDNETVKIGNNLIEPKTNYLQATSTFYNQLLSIFNIKDDEIIFDINQTKVLVRNYCPGINGNNHNKLRTQINLNPSEFQIYQIKEDTIINFTLKPLRTLISFAETFNLSIDLHFNVGNEPLVFVLKNPTFIVDFIVATINPCTNRNNDSNNNFNLSMLSNSIVVDKLPKSNSNHDKENNCDNVENDVVDTPQSKRAKTVFSRCLDETFHSTVLGDILVENSDSE